MGRMADRYGRKPVLIAICIAAAILPKVVSGDAIIALALTEPRGGSDASHLVVSATRKGDSFIFKGEKTSISFAEQASSMLTFARTNPDDPDLWRRMSTGEVTFHDVSGDHISMIRAPHAADTARAIDEVFLSHVDDAELEVIDTVFARIAKALP